MTLKTRDQDLQPIPTFSFVNRREIDLVLGALLQVARDGHIDEADADGYSDLLDAFQTFALSV
jgi:hypothetical protein